MLKSSVVLFVLLILGFAMNPGPDAHREKLKSEIAARNQVAGLLRLGNLAALASTHHTLGIASYSTIDQKTVTYGAFGVVFVPNLSQK